MTNNQKSLHIFVKEKKKAGRADMIRRVYFNMLLLIITIAESFRRGTLTYHLATDCRFMKKKKGIIKNINYSLVLGSQQERDHFFSFPILGIIFHFITHIPWLSIKRFHLRKS